MVSEAVVQAYKLDRSGVARLFGELEASVMESLWELGEGTVTSVSAHLEAPQQYTTIQTVMNRLVDKGVLERCGRIGGAVVYRAVQSRDALIERVSRDLVASLLADFGNAGVAGLVDAVGQAAPEQLAALEAQIKARREATR
jgi:predicted transcriptional regulator